MFLIPEAWKGFFSLVRERTLSRRYFCTRIMTMNMSALSSLSVVVLALAAAAGCKQETAPPPRPPAQVSAIEVQPAVVPVTAAFVAQARSSHQVEVMARVSGFLEQILYREGELVQEGQIMFQLDRKPFQVQVDAARAEVEIRRAQLWTAQANLDRIKPLAELDAASKSDLDNSVGGVKTAEAALAEALARLDKAKLDLGYTTIKAPLTGISSQSLMREGAYLAATGPSASLTYVARLDPIWIEFSVSQNEIAQTRRSAAEGDLQLPQDQDYEVEVELSDGSRYPHKGRLSFADPSFSQQTGTFLVRAVLPNPDALLRPGMFVKAYLLGAFHPKAIVVPQKAVIQSPNGQIVYVVGERETAEARPVVVGEWIDGNWVINKGLHSGDRVIVDGLMRLAPGMPVTVVPPGQLPQNDKKAGQ
jgi:membrane fusion protein, multidrug efflux system